MARRDIEKDRLALYAAFLAAKPNPNLARQLFGYDDRQGGPKSGAGYDGPNPRKQRQSNVPRDYTFWRGSANPGKAIRRKRYD